MNLKDILGEEFTDQDVEYLEGVSLPSAMIGLYLNAEPPYVTIADFNHDRGLQSRAPARSPSSDPRDKKTQTIAPIFVEDYEVVSDPLE